jgi:hypothetical protein
VRAGHGADPWHHAEDAQRPGGDRGIHRLSGGNWKQRGNCRPMRQPGESGRERTMSEAQTIPLPQDRRPSDDAMLQAARDFHGLMQRRRTVRDFDPRPVPRPPAPRRAARISSPGTSSRLPMPG